MPKDGMQAFTIMCNEYVARYPRLIKRTRIKRAMDTRFSLSYVIRFDYKFEG